MASALTVAQFAFVMQKSKRRGKGFGVRGCECEGYSSHSTLVLLYRRETAVGKFASYRRRSSRRVKSLDAEDREVLQSVKP
jgi:hypothetical protein